MRVRIKKANSDGIVRLESSGDIKEFLINEEFLNPKNESVSLCFKGKDSSGIIDLNINEIKELNKILREKSHLIKDFKVIRG